MLMAYETPYGIPFPTMGTIAIYISAIISVYSATEYSLQLIKKINKIEKIKNSQKKKAKQTLRALMNKELVLIKVNSR